MKPTAAASPAFALGTLLLIVPTVAVLQFRGVALFATLGLAATVLLHRARRQSWPWPHPPGAASLLAFALLAWLALSAAWAAEPWRALGTAAQLGAFVALGVAAACAVAEEEAGALRHLTRGLLVGLGLGIALALADGLSGNAIRAFVRGIKEVRPELAFGLKPAVSLVAVLLPLVVFLPGLRLAWRIGFAAAGLATALLLPADAAKLATLAGLAAGMAAMALGPWLLRAIAAALGLLVVAAPLLTAALLPRLPALETIPPSAAHRVLIWDFVVARIAERPLLGWGGEASRTLPGGQDGFDATTLARFGLTSEASRAWFGRANVQKLPLHTHNAALQLWLELGALGALLGAAVVAALGWQAAARLPRAVLPAATGAYVAAAIVGMLSYGVWQEWWIGVLLMLAATLAGLARQPAPSSAR